MSAFRIVGGERLSGTIEVQGSKNGVLPVMAAALLTGGETLITRVPRLTDVMSSIAILRSLGCRAEYSGGEVYVDSSGLCRCEVPRELMSSMRSSVFFLGALLGRCGEARISRPGGCELGERPIDIHLSALRALGAETAESRDTLTVRAARLRGGHVRLPYPSVGATENALMAAAAAEGDTIIENAAGEPEIGELAEYLGSAGVRVSGAGGALIRVRGTKSFGRSLVHRTHGDRIVAATYLFAAAATGGELELRGSEPGENGAVFAALRRMGCELREEKTAVRLRAPERLLGPGSVETGPYPAFPTDAQPLLAAASLRASGGAVITERVFERRFDYARELRKLGADIAVSGRTARIFQAAALKGADLTARDLRGGAALTVGALCAQGESLVTCAGHIERGYEDLPGGLRSLGGRIVRIDTDV